MVQNFNGFPNGGWPKPRVRSFLQNSFSDAVKTIRERFAMRFAKVCFSTKDISKVFTFMCFPFYRPTNGRNTRQFSSGGGQKCPRMFPLSQTNKLKPQHFLAKPSVRKGVSDSCSHCHRLATWASTALTVRQWPAAALTGCADVCKCYAFPGKSPIKFHERPAKVSRTCRKS